MKIDRKGQYKIQKGRCDDCEKEMEWRIWPNRPKVSYGVCAECAERRWYYQRRVKWESHRDE